MIAAIILAAGASSRMGRPKALLPLPARAGEGAPETFLSGIVRLAREAGAGWVVAALGPPHGEAIQKAPGRGPDAWAWNPAPERGMLSSLQAALPGLPAGAEGSLVWPVDTPLIQPGTLRALLGADLGRVIVPVHRGRGGHPVWVPGRLFRAVLALPVQGGLRQLMSDHPDAVLRLPVEDGGVLRDFDTPQDLRAL